MYYTRQRSTRTDGVVPLTHARTTCQDYTAVTPAARSAEPAGRRATWDTPRIVLRAAGALLFRVLFLYSRSVGPRCERERVQRQISQKRHEAEPCSRGDKIYHICKQEAHFITKNRVLLGMIAAPQFARQAQAPVFFRDALDFTAGEPRRLGMFHITCVNLTPRHRVQLLLSVNHAGASHRGDKV